VAQQQFAGIDAHKRSFTVAVIDGLNVEIDCASFANSCVGVSHALIWLDRMVAGEITRVGVEGSSGHGQQLSERLVGAGHDVREVPPRRTAERRRARRRPKTDREDALAIARATAGEPGLGPVKPGAGLGDAHDELVVVRDHRDMLVQRRKTMLNHAEAVLAGLPLALTDNSRDKTKVMPRLKAVLACSHPDAEVGLRARLDLLSEIYQDTVELAGRIRRLEKRLAGLVLACGSTLMEEHGIGPVGAATLLAEIADPARFRNEGAFNRWWGGAPVAISSGEADGEPRRHRLDLLGNRTVNSVIYLMSITQARFHPEAKDYLAGKRAEGKTGKEARRAHKTILGRRIIRRMWADRRRQLQPAACSQTHIAA
jgi:transposase